MGRKRPDHQQLEDNPPTDELPVFIPAPSLLEAPPTRRTGAPASILALEETTDATPLELPTAPADIDATRPISKEAMAALLAAEDLHLPPSGDELSPFDVVADATEIDLGPAADQVAAQLLGHVAVPEVSHTAPSPAPKGMRASGPRRSGPQPPAPPPAPPATPPPRRLPSPPVHRAPLPPSPRAASVPVIVGRRASEVAPTSGRAATLELDVTAPLQPRLPELGAIYPTAPPPRRAPLWPVVVALTGALVATLAAVGVLLR